MYAEFYENREIFFTGGSGVVGKSTIEKLLRSCNVKRIYLLIRSKRAASAEDRLEDIKNSSIFKVLKGQKPTELDKLTAISGDVGLDGLNISPQDREKMRNVSIFFHAAATIRFNEPLHIALRYNLKGTVECLKLAETLTNLTMFVYVSTFYSNPHIKYVENKMYPAAFDWRTALTMLEAHEKNPVLDIITNKIITDFPNTYVFTKHMAEHAVNDYRFKFPVFIYRPSIVVNAIEEPEPGFTESYIGMVGTFLATGTGMVQIILMRKDVQMDFIALDYNAKILLMSTVRAAQLPREKIEEKIPITIATSHGMLQQRLGEYPSIFSAATRDVPFLKSIWIPNAWGTSCPFVYYFVSYLLQVVPAILLDCLLWLAGKKPFFVAIQRKVILTLQVVLFFTTTQFISDGITDLDELERSGRGTDFSLSSGLNMIKESNSIKKVCRIYALGCRRYLLNEDDSSLPLARRLLKAKQLVYNVFRGYVLYLILKRVYQVGMNYFGY